MNFEELTATWAAQSTAKAHTPDIAALKQSVIPELKRRGRFLGYAVFTHVLGLVILPLLAVANYHYAPPRNPAWHWFYLAAWMLFLVTLLVAAIRGIQRHGARSWQCTRSLRDLTAASLISIEREMRSYRFAAWLAPVVIAFQLLDVLVKFPVSEFGWHPFGARAALIVGLQLLIGASFWRHYRINLKPALSRQKELRQQME